MKASMTLSNSGHDGAASSSQPDDEDGYYKDVYGELALGELPEINLLRHTFAHAGYKITKTEAMNTHPVLRAHVVRITAPGTCDEKIMRQHFRKLLCQAGFHVQTDELSVSLSPKQILLAFQWSSSPVDYAAGLREADEAAAEFVEM
jgi:hypothetical protein